MKTKTWLARAPARLPGHGCSGAGPVRRASRLCSRRLGGPRPQAGAAPRRGRADFAGRQSGATPAKAWLVAAVFAGALPLAGQQARQYRQGGEQVRELAGSIALTAPVRLVVEAQWGTIELRGQSGAAVGYRLVARMPAGPAAAAALARWPVQIERRGDEVVIATGAPDGGVERGELRLVLAVPRLVQRLRAETAVGNIRADGLAMPLVVATRAGNIRAGRVTGLLEASSRSGDIVVEHGGAVEARTSGSIRIGQADGPVVLATSGGEVTVGRAGGRVRITSEGGGIDIGQAAGPVVAYSDGGNIRLGAAVERAELHTGGGNIVVQSAHSIQCATRSGDIRLLQLLDGVEAQTGSGQIEAVFAPQARLAASELVAQHGNIQVRLPATVGAEVWAEIRSPEGHQIRSDYPALQAVGGGWGMVQARARLNGGGPALRLLSVGSDITVQHR